MTALAIFEHSNNEFSVEFLTGDGLAFRVLAPGLAKALGFREAFDLLRMIPDTEKGSELVRTLGGVQTVGFVTESGFYRALGQRQAARIPDDTIREQVERFQSWVYGTVLPSLRTGQRAAEKLTRADLARMVIEEADRAELAEARVAELEPRAEVADKLLNADGDLSVADTAKALTRAGVKVGEGRLFGALAERKWIFRHPGDGRWRPYQTAIETGYMSVLPMSHYHPKTGVLVLDPPQPRVTPKGLQKLLASHGAVAAPSPVRPAQQRAGHT